MTRREEEMLKKEAAPDYTYARFLLEEKHRELRVLDLQRRTQVLPDEYASCRRSLLQAIAELEDLLQFE